MHHTEFPELLLHESVHLPPTLKKCFAFSSRGVQKFLQHDWICLLKSQPYVYPLFTETIGIYKKWAGRDGRWRWFFTLCDGLATFGIWESTCSLSLCILLNNSFIRSNLIFHVCDVWMAVLWQNLNFVCSLYWSPKKCTLTSRPP